MQEWIKKHKSEMIVGIVVFFLTTLISWIGHWIVNAGPSTGRNILSSLRDLIFYNAANQNLLSLVILLLLTFLAIFFSTIIHTTISLIGETQKEIDYDELNSICDSLDDDEADVEIKKQIIEEGKRKLEKYKKKYVQKKESPKKVKKRMYIYLVFVVFLLLYILIYIITPALLWNTFELEITKVSPLLNDHEIKELKSDWVSMKTYDDFIVINDRFKEIKAGQQNRQ